MSAPKTVPDTLADTLARIARHARPANEVSRREARVRTRAALAMAQRRGVPVRGPVWDAANNAPALPTEAVEQLARALDAGASLIVLSGSPGSGKSVALARAVLGSEHPALLVHASDLHTLLAGPAGVVRDLDAEDGALRLAEVALLAIDDLGVEPAGGSAAALAALLCRRIDVGALTCVSTNLDEAAFRARYLDGEHGRLRSRFARHGALCALSPVDYRAAPGTLPPAR